MSTKTTIKRIALVAAASLGLGVLSVVPANAAPTQITFTVVNGTKVLGSAIDTTGAATITVTANHSAATDTTYVTIVPKSFPAGTSGKVTGNMQFIDTAVSGITLGTTDTVTITDNTGAAVAGAGYSPASVASGASLGGVATGYSPKSVSRAGVDSITTTYSGGGSLGAWRLNKGAASTIGYVGGRFNLYLSSDATANILAGTYTFTLTATPVTGTTAGTPVTQDVSIVVSASSASSATSTAYLGTGTTSPTSDASNPSAASTASNSTAAGTIGITLLDSNSSQVPSDTVIVTTTIGNLGNSGATAVGKNVQFAYSGTKLNIGLFPDGTSGTATISISTNSGLTFATKSFTFYSSTISTLSVTPVSTTLATGSNANALIVVAKDSSGNWINSAANIYLFSDNTSVVTETATAGCTAVAASQYAVCTLTGGVAGTANVMVGSTAGKLLPSAAIAVRVTTNPVASIAITSNKTSYLPGEKAYIRVTAKDSAGNSVAPQTISNFFASGGISTDVGLGSGSDTLTGTTAILAANTTTGYSTGDAVLQYTVYMPAGASSIKFSATGGTGLPAAAQTAVSLTVSVTDSNAQALAAVTALASQVSAFITKINAQITTLTDLVMKIQKKVKA